MKIIDLNKIRKALPNVAKVKIGKTKNGGVPFIECLVHPSLSEEDFEMCKEWQRNIIGKENIMEFYTEETGRHWLIYLKRVPMEFSGCSDDNINSFVNMEIVKGGDLVR